MLALLDLRRAGGGGGGDMSDAWEDDLVLFGTEGDFRSRVFSFEFSCDASGLWMLCVLPLLLEGGGGGTTLWDDVLSVMLGG